MSKEMEDFSKEFTLRLLLCQRFNDHGTACGDLPIILLDQVKFRAESPRVESPKDFPREELTILFSRPKRPPYVCCSRRMLYPVQKQQDFPPAPASPTPPGG